jgi:tetratricopeptide (TPR) repeat protein
MLAQLAKLDQIQTLVPCLEQLARAYTGLGLENEAAQTIQRYLELIDRNPNLHWVCDISLLFACRWYAARSGSGALDVARACVQRLERAHTQMRSPRTAAALAEARATVAAASGAAAQAVTDYRRAIAGWEALGHQYDSVRAYGNASRALAVAGEIEEACAAIDRALRIAEMLAVQLVDEDRRESFRSSQLMQELRHSLAELVNIP